MHAKFVAEHRLVEPDMHDQPSPCWEVYNQSDGQEISRLLWNPCRFIIMFTRDRRRTVFYASSILIVPFCLYLTLSSNVTPIRDFIYHLTANFFDICSAHPNPLVRSIGNYYLADLHHQYKKYTQTP
jgi:hypothetical protein